MPADAPDADVPRDPALHIDAYFQRIGYAGERAPSLATLRGLHLCHAQAIAFENLDPLMGRPVRLDLVSLQQKLVHAGRGGWCFEQNLLFSHALRALGFRVRCLSARVLWGQPEDAITARSHMLLRVDLDAGPCIADVGFGGQTLTGPLRLEPDVEQATPHEPFRLMRAGEGFKVQSKVGGAWKSLYRFDQQEQFQPDYEVSNYYLSHWPGSHFRHALMVGRPEADRRYALHNNQFSVHHLNGVTEQRSLTSAAELRRTLEGPFRLRLPDGAELDAVLERLVRMKDQDS
ncbi:MAG: arylamine N-acetyltransferase family protein [Acetobacteraceae bacterium]